MSIERAERHPRQGDVGLIDTGKRILTFHPRRMRSCIGCGLRLAPDSPAHHVWCRCCYAWQRAYVGLRALVDALHEVRR